MHPTKNPQFHIASVQFIDPNDVTICRDDPGTVDDSGNPVCHAEQQQAHARDQNHWAYCQL
jgi:hypothetical protein